jgi:hypothetical protein
MNRIETYLDDIYGILNAKPVIKFTDAKLEHGQYVSHSSLNGPVRIKFTVTNARGEIYVRIKQGTRVLYSSTKTSERNFDISVSKKATVVGDYIYEVEVEDNLGNITKANLTNRVIDMQLHFCSRTNEIIIEPLELLVEYNDIENTNISIPYNLMFTATNPPYSNISIIYHIDNEEWRELGQINKNI